MTPARSIATEETAAAVAPRKLRRGPITRKQILDSSLRLFSEKGFSRTSVRDIAQAAGITDAAIYYHFSSKRDLFEALIEERGFTAALEGLERTEIAELNVGHEEAISSIAVNALEFMYTNRDFLKVLMVEAMAEDAVATDEYRILTERWEKALARILRHFAGQGAICTEDVDVLAQQIVVTVIGAFSDHLMSPQPPAPPEGLPADLRRRVDLSMRHIVRGITARP